MMHLMMQEALKIFMTKKDSHLDYVCPVCFNQINHCSCDRMPWYAIQIDRNIQQHIRMLNTKGYKTKYCCESHKPTESMYIEFNCDYGIGNVIELPEGFERHGNGVSWICKRNMTDDEYKSEKNKHLKYLLDWCKSLP